MIEREKGISEREREKKIERERGGKSEREKG